MNRSAVWRGPGAADGRAREIVTAHGHTAFSRIALLPSYRRTVMEGPSVVAWIRRGPLALVLSEPVGPESAKETAVAGFTGLCRRAGLFPVWVPVAADRLPIFEAAGYRSLEIGRTAGVDLQCFDISGRRARSLRNGINRARRAGLHFRTWAPGDRGWEPLREISDAWLGRKRLGERRFGLGWFDPEYLETQRVAVVESRFGRIEAFATWMDTHGGTEGALDLMRFRPEAPPGTMDFLIEGIARRLAAEGKETLDLGLAPLSGVSGRVPEKVLGWAFRHGKPFYDFWGLYLWKNKWKPRWQPMALTYSPFWRMPPVLEGFSRLVSHCAADLRMGSAQFGGFARNHGHRKG